MSPLKAFVCGITGNQGGAVATALLARGATVHALCRDLTTAKAQALAAAGAMLFHGSYADEQCLASALYGCDAAFVNLVPNMADPTGELTQGTALLAACKAAGVKHVVYSSGLGTDAPEKLVRYEPDSFFAGMVRNKQGIEALVRQEFTYWTILRPGHMNTNYMNPGSGPFAGLYETGECWTAATKECKMATIDPATIGAFAAAAMAEPDKFHKQELPMAEEMLTLDDIMDKLSAVTGRTLRVRYYEEETLEQELKTKPWLLAQVNMRNMADFADVQRLKEFGVPLSSFDKFLEREAATLRDMYKL